MFLKCVRLNSGKVYRTYYRQMLCSGQKINVLNAKNLRIFFFDAEMSQHTIIDDLTDNGR
jgi:hypothetical protein